MKNYLKGRRGRLAAVALALAALASGPAGGQEVLTEASYLIETIEVEGSARYTREIVIAESLLEEGRIYTESQLRDAAHRIGRLPQVLDTRFSLRKGSERDRYTLVIEVEEASRWFVGFDSESDTGDDPGVLTGVDFLVDDTDRSLFVGWRASAGRHGVFSIAGDPFDGGKVQLGYTHFDFLGRSIRISANYLAEPVEDRDFQRSQTGKLSVGIPLRGNHSLSLSSSYQEIDVRFEITAAALDFDLRLQSLIHNASWVYNTLDDPIFPTAGRFFRAGGEYRELRGLFAGPRFDVGGDVVRFSSRQQADQLRLLVTGDRYWSLSPRTSLSASLELAAGGADKVFPTEELNDDGTPRFDDVDLWQGSIGVGHQVFLLRNVTPPRWRELRWENRLELFNDELSFDREIPAELDLLSARRGVSFTSGLKFRSRWGVLGVSVIYRDIEGETR